MLDGLADDEVDEYLEENPKNIPLFEIDVIEAISPYVSEGDTEVEETLRETNPKSVDELRHAHEALEREMTISLRVKASTMEEVNLGTIDDPRLINIAKELASVNKSTMVDLLKEYKDIFTWSYSDMRGLDPQYYQHEIHLQMDAQPIQQRQYQMNPNYATKVKEEIDKLLWLGFICLVNRAT